MACIPGLDPTCNPIKDAIVGGVTSIFDKIAEIMVETAGWAVKTLVTGWIMIPSPIMDDQAIVGNLRKHTYWYVTAIAVAALLVAASRMALGNGRAAVDAAAGMGKLIAVTSLVVPITIGLTEAGDAYSRWIITESVGAGLDQRVALLAPTAAIPGITQLATIGITGFLVLVSVVQMLISIAVGGLKILLCGLAPLPAAASVTGGGNATLARYLTWLGAALLYKPVAATLYAGAFWMLGTAQSFETLLTGIVVIAGAIFAMPALLRLLAPLTAQVAGPSGGSIAGGIAGGVGKIATGAVRLSAARAGSSGGGGAPSPPKDGSGRGAPPTPAPQPTGTEPSTSSSNDTSPSPSPASPTGGTSEGSDGPGPTTPPDGTAATVTPPATTGTTGATQAGTTGAAKVATSGAPAAGPAGAAVAAGATVAESGAAGARKVGEMASGATEAGEQQ